MQNAKYSASIYLWQVINRNWICGIQWRCDVTRGFNDAEQATKSAIDETDSEPQPEAPTASDESTTETNDASTSQSEGSKQELWRHCALPAKPMMFWKLTLIPAVGRWPWTRSLPCTSFCAGFAVAFLRSERFLRLSSTSVQLLAPLLDPLTTPRRQECSVCAPAPLATRPPVSISVMIFRWMPRLAPWKAAWPTVDADKSCHSVVMFSWEEILNNAFDGDGPRPWLCWLAV